MSVKIQTIYRKKALLLGKHSYSASTTLYFLHCGIGQTLHNLVHPVRCPCSLYSIPVSSSVLLFSGLPRKWFPKLQSEISTPNLSAANIHYL